MAGFGPESTWFWRWYGGIGLFYFLRRKKGEAVFPAQEMGKSGRVASLQVGEWASGQVGEWASVSHNQDLQTCKPADLRTRRLANPQTGVKMSQEEIKAFQEEAWRMYRARYGAARRQVSREVFDGLLASMLIGEVHVLTDAPTCWPLSVVVATACRVQAEREQVCM